MLKFHPIVYVQPKSTEATEFFNLIMRKIHACKVVKTENEKLLLKPINQNYQFWISSRNDSNWELIK
jgi:predicted metal-dependent phosphoesterase TrpH